MAIQPNRFSIDSFVHRSVSTNKKSYNINARTESLSFGI